MKPRERLNLALNHQEPDRVPIDMGGIVTGITKVAHEKLREYLGIEGEEIIIDRIQQLVKPEAEILDKFGIDTRYVYLGGSRDHKNKEFTDRIYVDEWGVKRRRAELSTGGCYYDIIESPFEDARLEDLKKIDWPDPEDPARVAGLAEQASRLHEETDYAVIVNAIGSVFEFTWYTRGFKQFLMDIALNQDIVCYLMDRMLEFQMGLFEQILSETGEYVDVVMVGDDIANQQGPTISPDLYRKLVKPRQKKLYDLIKSKTDAKLFYHSCGSSRTFISDLIEIGVDIINPVQVAANKMNPVELKKEFGNDITFWGGIDTQHVLPYGDPQNVKDEVKRRIDQLAPGGGFVLNSVHNIQSDVAPENIVAMFEAALEYGEY